jgi:hypothetical protein
LLNVAVCQSGRCFTVPIDDSEVVEIFDIINDHGVAACPVSGGKWVIAAQSLILAFLIYPIVAVLVDFDLRFKRTACLIPLTIALGLAISSVAVWAVMCIDDFNEGEYSKGELSGAFGFEIAILAILLAGSISALIFQLFPTGKSAAEVPAPVQMASPSAAMSAFKNEAASPSNSTVVYTGVDSPTGEDSNKGFGY